MGSMTWDWTQVRVNCQNDWGQQMNEMDGGARTKTKDRDDFLRLLTQIDTKQCTNR